MQHRIVRISPFAAAKTLSAAYAVVGLVIGGLQAMGLNSRSRRENLTPATALLEPVVTLAIVGFLMTLVACAMYSVAATWTKSIELQLESDLKA